jgi:hypothetical protein
LTINEKKEFVKNELTNLFIDKYDFFTEIINKLNDILNKYNVDYKYDYNSFCKDYLNKCEYLIDNEPDINVHDNFFLVYGVISALIINDKNEKILNE